MANDDTTIEDSLDDLCAAIEQGQALRVWDERVVAAQAYLAAHGATAPPPEPPLFGEWDWLPPLEPEDPEPGSGKARLEAAVSAALESSNYPF